MQVITKLQEIGKFQNSLQQFSQLSLDTETSGLDFNSCKLYIISVAFEDDEVYVFDCLKLSKNDITYIVSLLTNKLVVCHNAKFDIKVLKVQTGILLKNLYCTQTTETMIHNGLGKAYYSLEELVDVYFNKQLNKAVRESFYKEGILTSLTNEQLIYAAEDVIYLLPMMQMQMELIKQSKQDRPHSLEMQLLSVVAKMELEGMLLDAVAWKKLTVKRKEELVELEAAIKESLFSKIKLDDFETLYDFITTFKLTSDQIGYNTKTKRDTNLLQSIKDKDCYKDTFYKIFNVSSNMQLKILLNYIGYKLESTNEKYLANFKNDKIIELVLKYRETDKLVSTYGDNFLENINPVTGRVHASFNSVGTKTGRFSSDGPNLQNITKAEGYRECFPAPEGDFFLDTDYSQMEFRELGAASGDRVIIDAYKQGKDMHIATAMVVYGDEKERFKGKTINFANAYGSSDYGLAYNMNITVEKAKEVLSLFWEGYSTLAKFKEKVEGLIWRNKFSCTLLGRKCYFEDRTGFTDIKEYHRYKTKTLREGFSVLIQGTCAEIIKMVMVRIDNEDPFGDNLKMVLQVHDELGFYVKKEIIEEATKFVIRIMEEEEQVFLRDLPAKASFVVNTHWAH